jgi:magnesium chelatase subunit D
LRPIELQRDHRTAVASGRRGVTESETRNGRYVRARIPENGKTSDIAFDATLRSAAPWQRLRDRQDLAFAITTSDLREKVREKKTGSTIAFVVDSSGSMGASRRMEAAKTAVLSLLLDAYQKRDRVAMVAFRGSGAEVILPPTNSIELARKCLEILPTGGKTPLARGLLAGYELLKREMNRNSKIRPFMIIFSDGRANYSSSETGHPFREALDISDLIRASGISSVVVDTETGLIRLEKMRELADRIGGTYYQLEHLRSDQLVDIMRREQQSIFNS